MKKTENEIDIKTSSYEKIEKAELKRIEMSQLPKELPDFKNSFESKDTVIKKWLSDWIHNGIKKGSLKENTLLPKKTDLAYHLGVSVGTVQNAIRFVEDTGLLESKQRIGTIIRNSNAQNPIIRKASSKREKVITLIKKYIADNNLKPGDALPSSRTMASLIGNSINTIRLALDYLCSTGLIQATAFRSNDANWIVQKQPEFSQEEKAVFEEESLSSDTLVTKVKEDLKKYIQMNHKVGDKMPAHFELSEILKVSVKTVHDAMSALIEDGILLARRGRYGTTVIRMPNQPSMLQPVNEISICANKASSVFAKAEDAAFYSYQKIENAIKAYIGNNFEVGDKIPSMEALSKEFDVSSNTVRKALQNLAKQGYVSFARGRYGGTFVTELPENETQEAFRWLAVSPQYKISYDSSSN